MAERLNLLREVGAGLIIAQERAREGKQQMRPGEGQWYTTVPRWGGGVGGEVGNATGNTDESAPKKEDKKNGNRAKSRKEANAEAYKRVAPGPGNWDPKVTYSHIGKESRGDVDHIYLVSSLNHHVSIVQLRVHASYLQFLESGKLPSDQDYPMSLDGTPWYELRMCRTKWFDLFCAEDRLELMRGFWGIMAWMMRGET
ncbi:MAG: hypothetical protein M1837_000248 [Sclerophora amabilis]|nr:MAG: hypothetical protein M1837_000248 [Sclerophora amabilis]